MITVNDKKKNIIRYIVVSIILIIVLGYIGYMMMTDNLISDTFNQKEHMNTNEKINSTLTENVD